MLYGVDVSKWQGSIDWRTVAKTKFKFAMLRASYSVKGVDPYFYSNAVKALQAGIPIGAYHYCYATSVNSAKLEAEHFIRTIKNVPLAYPTALDIEDRAQQALSRNMVTEIALAFLTTLQAAGYYAIFYTNEYFAQSKLDMDKLKGFDFWLAQYREDGFTYQGPVSMWQYTNEGEVEGISGAVDCDISYKDYPTIIKSGGYNHWKKEDDMEDITVDEAKRIIQQKTDFDDNTMLYLEFYRYSDSMLKRMALAMQTEKY